MDTSERVSSHHKILEYVRASGRPHGKAPRPLELFPRLFITDRQAPLTGQEQGRILSLEYLL